VTEPVYSHRDRRAHREVWRMLGILAGGASALALTALWAPGWVVPLGAIAAIIGFGGAVVRWGDRVVEEYESDLLVVREGRQSSGFVRAEVGSQVGLERKASVATGPSPHRRRGAPGR
jgi:hypothetical protein